MTDFCKNAAVLACSLFILFSCKNDTKPPVTAQGPKVDTMRVNPVSTEGAVNYVITEGTVNWTGTNSVSKSGHQGTITVKSGELMVNQGQMLNGLVILDMNSISVADIKDPGERRDLESHLKDSDFFEANKYPTAEFSFMEVMPSTMPNFNWVISGTLTMKDKTNPVNIPVKVTLDGDMLYAETPSFPINRTQWGVNFKSSVIGTVKDKMIDDNVPVSLKLVAKKRK